MYNTQDECESLELFYSAQWILIGLPCILYIGFCAFYYLKCFHNYCIVEYTFTAFLSHGENVYWKKKIIEAKYDHCSVMMSPAVGGLG